jgi:hypothetical protein
MTYRKEFEELKGKIDNNLNHSNSIRFEKKEVRDRYDAEFSCKSYSYFYFKITTII